MSKDDEIIEEYEDLVQTKFKEVHAVKLPKGQITLTPNTSLNLPEEKLKDEFTYKPIIVEHKVERKTKPKDNDKPTIPELW